MGWGGVTLSGICSVFLLCGDKEQFNVAVAEMTPGSNASGIDLAISVSLESGGLQCPRILRRSRT